MTLRRLVSMPLSLLALPLILSLAGCNSLQSIQVLPTTGATTLTVLGQTVQFTAVGTGQIGSASPTTSNITNSVTWSVSNPSVATISSSGLATAMGDGHTQVMAQSNGVLATSDLTVNIAPGANSTSGGGSITSLSVIPGSQSVSSPDQTGQFLAIGTSSTGATLDLTGQVTWSSSSAQIATINSSGLATAAGQGTTTITALYANPAGGTAVVGTATFSVSGGTIEKYIAVTILPGSQALSSSGQTGQFIALGTSGTNGLQTDVTSSPQVKWSSSAPSIASVSATGLATGLSAGSSTITAELTNADGSVVSNIASVTVSTTALLEPLLSITIIPSSITVGNLQDTGQFLAIGTYSTAPYVRDLTNSPTLTWISSVPSVFPVNTNSGGNAGATAGIVSAYGNGNAVIVAEATSSDGTIQTATATFSCPLALPDPSGNPPTPGTCYSGSQAASLLATLTVYSTGLNTTDWEVTAPSATGSANVLHCGPGWALNGGSGGSVCVATYPVGSIVTLTAPATGAAFGGWSSNCLNSNPPFNSPSPNPSSVTGPNTCTLQLTTNDTVGAIFN